MLFARCAVGILQVKDMSFTSCFNHLSHYLSGIVKLYIISFLIYNGYFWLSPFLEINIKYHRLCMNFIL